MKQNEVYKLKGKSICEKVLKENPTYKVFWMSGYAFKGAKKVVDDKQPKMQFISQEARSRVLTFEERMQRRYDWAAGIDILVDHEKKEIHFNGFSCNDLY